MRNKIGRTLVCALLLSSAPSTFMAQNAPPPATTNAQAPAREPDKAGAGEDIQVSFQGANIDMVVQWLAKTTGKSVVKHKGVQCQLTIVSSKKLPPRDAVNLVYRALALEGFTTLETSKSILIVPENQEPKVGPELLDGSKTDLPDGRQKLIKNEPLIVPSQLPGRLVEHAVIRYPSEPCFLNECVVSLEHGEMQL